MNDWVIRIITVACIGVLTEILLPAGNIKKMASLVTALSLMIVVISPLAQLLRTPQEIDFSLTENTGYTDTDGLEEKMRSDILAILQGYDGYEEAEVRVRADGTTPELKEVEIRLPSGDKSMSAVVNKDDTVKAVISAFYRIASDKISIKRQAS